MQRLFVISLIAMGTVLPQTSPAPDDWRAWFSKGVQEYRIANYKNAISDFQKAVSLNPSDANLHLYLGTSWMCTYVPTDESPENLERARNAESEFKSVLRIDPVHKAALAWLASLAYMQAGPLRFPEKLTKLDEAAAWYDRIASSHPQDSLGHYSLGVIAWAKVFPMRMAARNKAGMPPEQAGPLQDAKMRKLLKAANGPVIDRGIAELEKALAINPNSDDAMAYLNLLYRERADLDDTSEDYRRDTAAADQWVKRALTAMQAKRQRNSIVFEKTGPDVAPLLPPPLLPPPPPPPQSKR